MKVWGLTGGVAAGKSAVAARLRARGVPVIDADQVARDVVAPGTPALRAIAAEFPDAIQPDGTLDRRAMRARIVADPSARARLEAITHPAIRAAVQAELAALALAGVPHAVVEAALMVETGSYRGYDGVIVVSVSPRVQLARLMERDGVDEAAARGLIGTQLPMAAKEAVATEVIRNDGTLAQLHAAVDAAWSRLTR